jgi:hypothetical protein
VFLESGPVEVPVSAAMSLGDEFALEQLFRRKVLDGFTETLLNFVEWTDEIDPHTGRLRMTATLKVARPDAPVLPKPEEAARG